MAPLLPADLLPAVLGGHSTEPYWVAIPFIAFALIMRMRGRAGRRGGPWQGGPPGGGTGNDPPMQWDIRKTPEPEATPDAPSDAPSDAPKNAPSEEQNPPTDL